MEPVGGLNGVAAAVPDGSAFSISPLPGLDEKFVLDAGNGQAVVVPRLRKADEVVASLRGQRGEKHGLEHTRRGIEHRDGVARRRVGELHLGGLHRRAGDGFRPRSAAELVLERTTRQRHTAQERQHRQRFFIKTIHNSDLSVNSIVTASRSPGTEQAVHRVQYSIFLRRMREGNA